MKLRLLTAAVAACFALQVQAETDNSRTLRLLISLSLQEPIRENGFEFFAENFSENAEFCVPGTTKLLSMESVGAKNPLNGGSGTSYLSIICVDNEKGEPRFVNNVLFVGKSMKQVPLGIDEDTQRYFEKLAKTLLGNGSRMVSPMDGDGAPAGYNPRE